MNGPGCRRPGGRCLGVRSPAEPQGRPGGPAGPSAGRSRGLRKARPIGRPLARSRPPVAATSRGTIRQMLVPPPLPGMPRPPALPDAPLAIRSACRSIRWAEPARRARSEPRGPASGQSPRRGYATCHRRKAIPFGSRLNVLEFRCPTSYTRLRGLHLPGVLSACGKRVVKPRWPGPSDRIDPGAAACKCVMRRRFRLLWNG